MDRWRYRFSGASMGGTCRGVHEKSRRLVNVGDSLPTFRSIDARIIYSL
jgi:hypothetical protein